MKPDHISAARKVALACVGIIAVFLMALAVWIIYLVQSDWCAVAVGNAQYINGRPETAISGCIELLKAQVDGLAKPLLIVICGMVAALFAFVVLGVLGGRASVTAPGGFGASIGSGEPETPAEGAQIAADAAQGVAAELQEKTP